MKQFVMQLSVLLLASPAAAATDAVPHVVTEAGLLAHIKTLASDAYEGRAPGTAGEAKTIAYIEREFRKLGLKPGNPDGSYLQTVPMRGMQATPAFSYTLGGKRTALRFPDDYVAHSSGPAAEVSLKRSELVFVGYGVIAPEYGWDDYKGVDVRGKTLVMLINDPPLADPRDPSRLDPAQFRGAGMTYYGRWTYKYEIAARLGAAAAIIVHETQPAAYPYDVVRAGGLAEQFELAERPPAGSTPSVRIPAWIQGDRARDLFAAAGLDFDALKQAAATRDFTPVSLRGTAHFQISNKVRQIASHNVVARIEGSDPELKNDVVVYSAHWDHLGIDRKLPGPRGKQIYHGALDNASGVAALLELAKAYQALPVPPKRSILFIATTAEESGLLGAQHYARHPLYPLARTVANINIDGINAWGKTAHIENVTSGHSTIDDLLSKHALAQGRTAEADARPELGSFYRADQLEFARQGVPVLYTKARSKFIGKSDTYAREIVDSYYARDYHKVSDDVRADWDFSGGVQDIELLFKVGYDIAMGATPRWHDSSEFKARRP